MKRLFASNLFRVGIGVSVLIVAVSLFRSASSRSWARVERGSLQLEVDVEGTLKAESSRQFGPPVTPGMWEFKIAFMASEGKSVKQGERILAFDASGLQEQLQQATSELESARSEIEKKSKSTTLRQRDAALKLEEARGKLTKSELKLSRPAEFVSRKELAELELDRRVNAREVEHLETSGKLLDEADDVEMAILENQRDNAARRAQDLRDAIDRMTMHAPQDGTVIYVSDRRGEKKRMGDTVWLREKVLSIPDLSRMSAEGLVDEADAGRLKLEQRVEFRLDAHPEITFRGTVHSIGKTVQPRTRNSPLRVVRVGIELDETDESRMRPEMRFRGNIEVSRLEQVLLAPLSSIDTSSGEPTVFRASFMSGDPVKVTLGARNDTVVEVLTGLEDGDRIQRLARVTP